MWHWGIGFGSEVGLVEKVGELELGLLAWRIMVGVSVRERERERGENGSEANLS